METETARQLRMYNLVNQSETVDQLCDAIDEIAEDNYVMGKTREFPAKFQKVGVRKFVKMNSDNMIPPNVITRSYGLRQQAMYLKYYHELEKKKEVNDILDNPCGEIPLKKKDDD